MGYFMAYPSSKSWNLTCNVKLEIVKPLKQSQGGILGEGAGGAHPPPPEMICGFLIQLEFCKKKNYVVYW